MRIQHNVMALNSYNKLATNNSNLSKNLEKLSSGYKINRAADNAAGLAISEKMRAQITGLETCQQNAKDGISLVQTAEGALTEVHSMLNRMVALTTQASNGIYENSEREKIQDELDQLNEEIDRIADATNFNGIKLLDGTMGAGGVKGGSGTAGNGKSVIDVSKNITKAFTAATEGNYKATLAANSVKGALDKVGAEGTLTFDVKIGDELKQISVKVGISSTTTNGTITINGTEYGSGLAAANPTEKELVTALKAAVDAGDESLKELTDLFDMAAAGTAGEIEFTAKEKGTAGPQIVSVSLTGTKADGTSGTNYSIALTQTANTGNDDTDTITFANMKQYTGAATGAGSLEDSLMEIDGKKFVVVKGDIAQKHLDALDPDVKVISVSKAAAAGAVDGANLTADDKGAVLTGLKELLADSGLDVKYDDATTPTGISFTRATPKAADAAGSLRLQIGDTNDPFNMLDVSVEDCHADAIGVGKTRMRVDDVDTANQAMMDAKAAIEYVSSVRSNLGAIQNRLDHTLNNLQETTTNLTDAESRIRDTDMAEEMMKYTKNNILIQSSQAMLAQANQVPQGVLQLLQ